MSCINFLVALTSILLVQGAMQEPAPAPAQGGTKIMEASQVKKAGEKDAAILNAQATHSPVVEYILFEHWTNKEKCPVQALPVDLTSGSVKAGEILGAWEMPGAPRPYLPQEGDTVDFHELRRWEGRQAQTAGVVIESSMRNQAQMDHSPPQTGFVLFSFAWIKKNKVKSVVPLLDVVRPRYTLEYCIMVRYRDRENRIFTRQLGEEEDKFGRTVYNVQRGNAEKYKAELEDMERRKAEAAANRPPRTRDGILKILEEEPEKVRLFPMATNDEAINYLMRTHVDTIAGLEKIPFDDVVQTVKRRWQGQEYTVDLNKDIQAGEIVSLWSGDDPIFQDAQIIQSLKNSEYDLRAFFATYDNGEFGLPALTHQLSVLPKTGDTVWYYANDEDLEAVRGVVYESYRLAGKFKEGTKFKPYMQVEVYFLGPHGKERKLILYQNEPKNRDLRRKSCFQHTPGPVDNSDPWGQALVRALVAFTNGRGEDLPEEARPPLVSRPAIRMAEGVEGVIQQNKAKGIFGLKRTSVAVSENAGTISIDYYAGGFCFLIVLVFLVKFCQRKPTPEEQPLYEPLF